MRQCEYILAFVLPPPPPPMMMMMKMMQPAKRHTHSHTLRIRYNCTLSGARKHADGNRTHARALKLLLRGRAVAIQIRVRQCAIGIPHLLVLFALAHRAAATAAAAVTQSPASCGSCVRTINSCNMSTQSAYIRTVQPDPQKQPIETVYHVK